LTALGFGWPARLAGWHAGAFFFGGTMPKSRRRKKKVGALSPGVMRMTPEVHDALLKQREAFRAKFGRDPDPNDPVIFDADIPSMS
jgi:hypothetical protein